MPNIEHGLRKGLTQDGEPGRGAVPGDDGGRLGLIALGARKLDAYRNELARLEEECRISREAAEVLNKTLETLLNETSGVVIVERNRRRYVTAPAGSESGHAINGRPAMQLKE